MIRSRRRTRHPLEGPGIDGGFVPNWTPAALGHTALYDHHLGGSSTQTTDSSPNARAALAFGASTAAPTHVPYAGTSFIYWPVVHRMNTPSIAAYNVTDLDVWVDVALDSWTPTSLTSLVTRQSADPNRQFSMTVDTAGKLITTWYPTGSLASAVAFTPTNSITTDTGVAAGGRCALRVTLDTDNGASGHTFTAYYRLGGYDGTWTQFYTVTTAGVLAAPSVSRVLEVGTQGAGGAIRGIYGFQMQASIGGATIASVDPANVGQGTSYTDPQTRVWTVTYATSGLTGAVKSATANDPYSGVATDGVNDTATGPTAAIPALAAGDACTLYCVTRPRATLATNQTFFSTRSGTGAGVTLRMASATTVVADVSDGTTTATTPAVTITPGLRYVLGVVVTAGAPGTAYVVANNTAGSTVARTGNAETGGALTVFSNSTPADFARTHSRVHFASIPRAISALDLANLVTFHRGGV